MCSDPDLLIYWFSIAIVGVATPKSNLASQKVLVAFVCSTWLCIQSSTWSWITSSSLHRVLCIHLGTDCMGHLRRDLPTQRPCQGHVTLYRVQLALEFRNRICYPISWAFLVSYHVGSTNLIYSCERWPRQRWSRLECILHLGSYMHGRIDLHLLHDPRNERLVTRGNRSDVSEYRPTQISPIPPPTFRWRNQRAKRTRQTKRRYQGCGS